MTKRHLILLVVVLAMLALLGPVGQAAATAPYGWTYAYNAYSNGTWVYSQSTTNAARHWPAAGYSTSSTYYRLGSSLSSTWKTRAGTAASTWSAVDNYFHFYELPLGSDSTDHTLGMNSTLQYPAFNWVDTRWDSANNRAYIYNWYIRFRTSLSPWGLSWVDGVQAGGVDIQGIETHELGHSILLDDLDGNWTDGTRPTMYEAVVVNSTAPRSLASGDTTGVSNLY